MQYFPPTAAVTEQSCFVAAVALEAAAAAAAVQDTLGTAAVTADCQMRDLLQQCRFAGPKQQCHEGLHVLLVCLLQATPPVDLQIADLVAAQHIAHYQLQQQAGILAALPRFLLLLLLLKPVPQIYLQLLPCSPLLWQPTAC